MSRTLVYTIAVYAKQPLAESEEECAETAYEYPTLERATDPVFKRDIERSVLACLRRFELDCDCEILSYEVEDE
jgi:hypothetical protein